jgi:hypothetical protein
MRAVLVGGEGGGTHDGVRRAIAIELLADHQHSDGVVKREPTLHHQRQGDQIQPSISHDDSGRASSGELTPLDHDPHQETLVVAFSPTEHLAAIRARGNPHRREQRRIRVE